MAIAVTFIRNAPVTGEALNTLRAASWEHVGAQDWQPVLARSLGWVCAVDGQRLVGFMHVAWDGGVHAFLLDTTVHRDYQRRGIGTALVQEAILLARDGGAEWLHVDYEEQLDPFYRGCGFRPTPAGLLDLSGDFAVTASGDERRGA